MARKKEVPHVLPENWGSSSASNRAKTDRIRGICSEPGAKTPNNQVLPVSGAPLVGCQRRGRSKGGENAYAGTHTAGLKEGAVRGPEVLPPADYSLNPRAVASSLEQGPIRQGQRHAMGSMLCWILWFPQIGELTAPEKEEFDPKQHLTVKDIAIENLANPRTISIRIEQSKTDPFRQGVTIYLGRTDSMLCPVAALLSYLVLRGRGEGPLFKFKDGRALSRPRLVSELRKALAEAGLKPENYAGHSFRIGAATTAAACSIPVEVIKTLGRWKSQAYQLYVRLPTNQLSGISKKLVQSNT